MVPKVIATGKKTERNKKHGKASLWKVKRNNLYNNYEDTYKNFDVKYCTQSSGKLRPLKKKIWFFLPLFALHPNIQLVVKIYRNHASDSLHACD